MPEPSNPCWKQDNIGEAKVDTINQAKAKKITTYDLKETENGYLIELGKDGPKTTSYLTVALPGCFKGYHMHTVRCSNYVCIRGKVDVVLFVKEGPYHGKSVFRLSAEGPDSLHIPINIPTAIHNPFPEEAWLINIPDPPYDPSLEGEQVDMN